MFDSLDRLPADPILGLMSAFQDDERTEKIDLGVGVYRDDTAQTPIMQAVVDAQRRLLEIETSKSYLPPAGPDDYNNGVQQLLLGDELVEGCDQRLTSLLTPGGCGALRIGAEVIRRSSSTCTVWVSDPTWPNHIPLLGGAGLQLKTYSYYDPTTKSLDFATMMSQLEQSKPGDVLLLHGCCHNPSGADLTLEQWQTVTEFVTDRELMPFVDVAYQGLGEGIDEDAAGWRYLAARVLSTQSKLNRCLNPNEDAICRGGRGVSPVLQRLFHTGYMFSTLTNHLHVSGGGAGILGRDISAIQRRDKVAHSE